jgi:hypothetical protein
MKKIYAEFCRLRDLRDAGAEAPKYTEAQAFEKSVLPSINDNAMELQDGAQRAVPVATPGDVK